MQVRVKTTPLGMCFRILSLLILGGVAAIVTEHSSWFQTVSATTQQQTAAPQPSPAPAPLPTPKASVAKLAVAVPSVHAVPPGWMDLGGILIPPPGYNDR